MLELRDRIRKGTNASPEEFQRALEELPIQLIPEALKAKAPHDGQTILVYAASCGNANLFIYLAEKLLNEVRGNNTLLKTRQFCCNIYCEESKLHHGHDLDKLQRGRAL